MCFLPNIIKMIKHSFPRINVCQAECDNVLQPEPRSDEGCNTLSHEGLANVNIRKRMLFAVQAATHYRQIGRQTAIENSVSSDL